MRGWELMKASWSVLQKDKELLIFPVLSGIACLLVAATFVAPFLVAPDFTQTMLAAADDNKAVDPESQLLVQVAERLRSCLRRVDTIARIGGDEFTVLLEDVGSTGDAALVAERIIEAFRVIAEEQAGGMGVVSASISEALVATALGLFVAIPAAWMFNHFAGKLKLFQVEMANASSELLDYLGAAPATSASGTG